MIAKPVVLSVLGHQPQDAAHGVEFQGRHGSRFIRQERDDTQHRPSRFLHLLAAERLRAGIFTIACAVDLESRVISNNGVSVSNALLDEFRACGA